MNLPLLSMKDHHDDESYYIVNDETDDHLRTVKKDLQKNRRKVVTDTMD